MSFIFFYKGNEVEKKKGNVLCGIAQVMAGAVRRDTVRRNTVRRAWQL